MLELAANAQARKARTLGVVHTVLVSNETKPWLSGEAPTGKGLAAVLAAVAKDWTNTDGCWIVSDLNGEVYRAADWGHALFRVAAAKLTQFQNPVVWHPLASFGDAGGANGALLACIVICAFQRGYAPAHTAIVLTSSDGPGREAVVLGQPQCRQSDLR